jgi:PAS domain-containing protein
MTLAGARELSAFVSRNNLSETVLGEIMDALPVAIYMTDAQGRLTYFNPAAAKLSGRTSEIGTDQWCVTWKIFLRTGRLCRTINARWRLR